MPLRCLVVDCGGVTHPDSGLKDAAWISKMPDLTLDLTSGLLRVKGISKVRLSILLNKSLPGYAKLDQFDLNLTSSSFDFHLPKLLWQCLEPPLALEFWVRGCAQACDG